MQEMIGQERALELAKSALKKGGRLRFNVLISGPPGSGKSHLADLVFGHLEKRVGTSTVRRARGAGSEANLLSMAYRRSRSRGDLLVDEVHTLTRSEQEALVREMSSRKVVAVTNSPWLLIEPLRSRFQLVVELDPYKVEDLAKIAREKGIREDWAWRLARMSRFSPRILTNLIEVVRACGDIDTAGKLLGLDEYGLTRDDLELLRVLFYEGAAGERVLSSRLGCPKQKLLEEERFLLRLGLIEISSRGREITPLGESCIMRREK